MGNELYNAIIGQGQSAVTENPWYQGGNTLLRNANNPIYDYKQGPYGRPYRTIDYNTTLISSAAQTILGSMLQSYGKKQAAREQSKMLQNAFSALSSGDTSLLAQTSPQAALLMQIENFKTGQDLQKQILLEKAKQEIKQQYAPPVEPVDVAQRKAVAQILLSGLQIPDDKKNALSKIVEAAQSPDDIKRVTEAAVKLQQYAPEERASEPVDVTQQKNSAKILLDGLGLSSSARDSLAAQLQSAQSPDDIKRIVDVAGKLKPQAIPDVKLKGIREKQSSLQEIDSAILALHKYKQKTGQAGKTYVYLTAAGLAPFGTSAEMLMEQLNYVAMSAARAKMGAGTGTSDKDVAAFRDLLASKKAIELGELEERLKRLNYYTKRTMYEEAKMLGSTGGYGKYSENVLNRLKGELNTDYEKKAYWSSFLAGAETMDNQTREIYNVKEQGLIYDGKNLKGYVVEDFPGTDKVPAGKVLLIRSGGRWLAKKLK